MKKCLMVTEGPYDKHRLMLLVDIFDSTKLEIVPFNSDALVIKDYFLNYKQHISNLLNKEKTYLIEDFDEIVQVCDLDGCFISDDSIIEDKLVRKIIYSSNSIKTNNKGSIIGQRNQKKINIHQIVNGNLFKLYYNSTNIDHAFNGVQNPSDNQKRALAKDTYQLYSSNLEDFLKFLYNLHVSKKGYKESWDYVMQDNNSLKACSNIWLFIIDHFDCLKEEYKTLVSSLR